jgi:uncharacterized membrane protein YphA (DoxX/SURF4 family)
VILQLVKKHLISLWTYRALRISLASVFIWAGGVKLLDPRAFARVISGYRLVPDELLPVVAIGLPALELLAGVGLVFDVRGSLKVICGLLVMFVFVLGFGIMKDLNVDCGCFSVEELHAKNSLRHAFYRDLVMLFMVSYLFLWRKVHSHAEEG